MIIILLFFTLFTLLLLLLSSGKSLLTHFTQVHGALGRSITIDASTVLEAGIELPCTARSIIGVRLVIVAVIVIRHDAILIATVIVDVF